MAQIMRRARLLFSSAYVPFGKKCPVANGQGSSHTFINPHQLASCLLADQPGSRLLKHIRASQQQTLNVNLNTVKGSTEADDWLYVEPFPLGFKVDCQGMFHVSDLQTCFFCSADFDSYGTVYNRNNR